MNGITLRFTKKVETSKDAFNNSIYDLVVISVDDCLIAPLSAPTAAREQQADHQVRDQVTIHLPKSFTGDLSGSSVAWDGRVYNLDSSSVVFMEENTPTRWNRYFTAECIGQFDDAGQSS